MNNQINILDLPNDILEHNIMFRLDYDSLVSFCNAFENYFCKVEPNKFWFKYIKNHYGRNLKYDKCLDYNYFASYIHMNNKNLFVIRATFSYLNNPNDYITKLLTGISANVNNLDN